MVLSLWSQRCHARRFFTSQQTSPSYNVLFFGSDIFSVPSLEMLVSAGRSCTSQGLVNRVDLICPPSKMKGRGQKMTASVTRLTAERINESDHTPKIGIHEVESQVDFSMKGFELPVCVDSPDGLYDIGVVVAFGYFLPPRIINAFKKGIVNVHPSILPLYRGAAPIQHALFHGDEETGVSLITLDPDNMDSGRILLQEKIKIMPDDTYASLSRQLAHNGASNLGKVLADFNMYYKRGVSQAEYQQQLGSICQNSPQGTADADGMYKNTTIYSNYIRNFAHGTMSPPVSIFNPPNPIPPAPLRSKWPWPFAPKIDKTYCKLDFQREGGDVIFNKYRGLQGYSDVYTSLRGKRVRILKMERPDSISATAIWKDTQRTNASFGSAWYDSKRKAIVVYCKKGKGGGFVQVDRPEAHQSVRDQEENDVAASSDLLLFTELQMETKGVVNARDFANAFFVAEGNKFD